MRRSLLSDRGGGWGWYGRGISPPDGRVAQIRNPNIEILNKFKILMSKSGNPILTPSEQFESFQFWLLELV